MTDEESRRIVERLWTAMEERAWGSSRNRCRPGREALTPQPPLPMRGRGGATAEAGRQRLCAPMWGEAASLLAGNFVDAMPKPYPAPAWRARWVEPIDGAMPSGPA